jgi:hypothetical protein
VPALEARATAALLLAGGLALLAVWPGAAPPAGCPGARRLPSLPGAAVAVGCEPGPGPAVDGAAGLLFDRALDLNRADARSLEALPAIGPARAAAIAAERCRRPFAAVTELERVHGIGRRTARALEPWVTVSAGPPAGCPSLH